MRRRVHIHLAAALASALLLGGAGRALAQGEAGGSAVGPVEERRIELLLGEQTTISAEGVSKYSPSNDVIDVRLPKDGTQFIVVAAKPGAATLLLVMRDGRQIKYIVTVRDDTVRKRDNIRLDFYFVELTKRSAYAVGIGWPASINGTAQLEYTRDLVSGQNVATAAVTAEALPRIDLAQEGGWARIYRQASVIVANGEAGLFNTGGELNVRLVGGLSADLQQIKFGSSVQVQPRYDRKTGRIEIRISADISELSDAAFEGVPGRTISQLQTLVNLEMGQSVVLAGADSRSAARDRNGLPLLSQIPVLGFLFGTHTGRNEQTENFIFIVPTVIEANDVSHRDLVERAMSIYSNFDGDHGDRPAMKRLTNGRRKRQR